MPDGPAVGITVGQLRAELLLLYADDVPVVVAVPDRGQSSFSSVLPVISAGTGPGAVPDEIASSVLYLRVEHWNPGAE